MKLRKVVASAPIDNSPSKTDELQGVKPFWFINNKIMIQRFAF